MVNNNYNPRVHYSPRKKIDAGKYSTAKNIAIGLGVSAVAYLFFNLTAGDFFKNVVAPGTVYSQSTKARDASTSTVSKLEANLK